MSNELPNQESHQSLNVTSNSRLSPMLAALFRAQSPDVGEAARHCSIPHYFNAELIKALADEPMTTEQANNVLEEINDWEFVQDLGNGRFVYRREIREHLRSELQTDSAGLFLILNQRAHSYFDGKLPGEYNINELSWLQLRREQISSLREKVYHLLHFDVEAGFSILQKLFRGAHRLFLLGEASTLLKFFQDLDVARMNEDIRNYLSYFEAVQLNADGEREFAEATLIMLQRQSLSQDLNAQALTLLGTIYHATNRFDDAINVFQQSKEISNSLQLVRQGAALSNNLGSVYLTKKDLNNAEKFFQQALVEFKKIGSVTEEAQVLNNLGTVRLRQRKWKEALDFLEKSLLLKAQIGDQFAAATTRVNIGTLYQQMSAEEQNEKNSKWKRETALRFYTEGLETFRMMGALSSQARVLFKLAYLYHEAQEDNRAKGFLEEALPLFKTLRLKKEDLEKATLLAKALHLKT